MNTAERLEMMAADYERRAAEARVGAEHFRKHGRMNYLRAAQATARKYEHEAIACRETITRNAQVAAALA